MNEPRTCLVDICRKHEAPTRYTLRYGMGLQALSAAHTTPIEYDCRHADCGICIIRVLNGGENLSEPTTREADFLRAMGADANERLACQCRVLGDISLKVEF